VVGGDIAQPDGKEAGIGRLRWQRQGRRPGFAERREGSWILSRASVICSWSSNFWAALAATASCLRR
jgi:hypothetical protein